MRFAAWRRRSLRGRLLVWLLTLHLVVGGLTAWFSYGAYGRLIRHFMDDQMRLLADSYAANRKPAQLQPLSGAADLARGAFVLQIWRADGSALLSSSWPAVAVPLQPQPGFSDVRTLPGEYGAWRVYTAAVPEGHPGHLRVQVVQSDGFRQHSVLRRALLEGLPVALLLPLAMLLLWWIVSIALRPLGGVVRAVSTQDAHHLVDLPVARVPDEIAPLVAAFNGLLMRLQAAFTTQRRFVQDAAHELRSPMTAIALQIENLRPHVRGVDADARFAQLEAGVQRALHLVEQLLSLSRQEAPTPGGTDAPVDVVALLRDSLGQLMVLADRRSVEVGFEGDIARQVDVPASELRCVFDNLIDNALRYTGAGSLVTVRVHAVDGHAVVDVLDQGPGIPAEWMARVFDRFVRVPGSGVAGSGLGLAIAQAAAARYGMRIELRNRGEAEGGAGLIARVHLC